MAAPVAANDVAELRAETIALYARFRVLIGKVAASDDAPRQVGEMRRAIEGFGDELRAYEEVYEEALVPATYRLRGAPLADPCRQIWGEVNNYDLWGCTGVVDAILERERREGPGAQEALKAARDGGDEEDFPEDAQGAGECENAGDPEAPETN